MHVLIRMVAITVFIWLLPSFSVAEGRSNGPPSLPNTPVSNEDSGWLPFYSSDQGLVTFIGKSVVILEGITGKEFKWLISQLGIKAVAQVLYNAGAISFYNNGNRWQGNNIYYAFQMLGGGALPKALIYGALFREAWKSYWKTGIWGVFAGQIPEQVFLQNKSNVYGLMTLAAILRGLGFAKEKLTTYETGQRAIALKGPEAANLLLQIDFDSGDSMNSSRLIISRIRGVGIENPRHSELSALALVMQKNQINSLTIDVFSEGLTATYFNLDGIPVSANLKIEEGAKEWLINLVKKRVPAPDWEKQQSVLSPKAIQTLISIIQYSTGAGRFPQGDISVLKRSETGIDYYVTLNSYKGFSHVESVSDKAVKLGGRYRLTMSENRISAVPELQTSRAGKGDYGQYRIPRWATHLLLVTASSAGHLVVNKGVNFITEKAVSPGWKMEQLHNNLAQHGENAQYRRYSEMYAHQDEVAKAYRVLNLRDGCSFEDVNHTMMRLHGDDQATQAGEFLRWFVPNRGNVTIINDQSRAADRKMYDQFKDYAPRL